MGLPPGSSSLIFGSSLMLMPHADKTAPLASSHPLAARHPLDNSAEYLSFKRFGRKLQVFALVAILFLSKRPGTEWNAPRGEPRFKAFLSIWSRLGKSRLASRSSPGPVPPRTTGGETPAQNRRIPPVEPISHALPGPDARPHLNWLERMRMVVVSSHCRCGPQWRSRSDTSRGPPIYMEHVGEALCPESRTGERPWFPPAGHSRVQTSRGDPSPAKAARRCAHSGTSRQGSPLHAPGYSPPPDAI